MERKEYTRLIIAMRGLERALRGPVRDNDSLLRELATLKYEVDAAWGALQYGEQRRQVRAAGEGGAARNPEDAAA